MGATPGAGNSSLIMPLASCGNRTVAAQHLLNLLNTDSQHALEKIAIPRGEMVFCRHIAYGKQFRATNCQETRAATSKESLSPLTATAPWWFLGSECVRLQKQGCKVLKGAKMPIRCCSL